MPPPVPVNPPVARAPPVPVLFAPPVPVVLAPPVPVVLVPPVPVVLGAAGAAGAGASLFDKPQPSESTRSPVIKRGRFIATFP